MVVDKTDLILFSGDVERSVAVLGSRMGRCTLVQQKESDALVIIVTCHM